MLFISSFSYFTFGQNSILTNVGSVNMTDPDESGFYSLTMNDPNYDFVTPISTANLLQTVLPTSLFTIDLPNDNIGAFTFKIKNFELSNTSNFNLFAELYDIPNGISNTFGYFHIESNNNLILGYIIINETKYNILPLNANNVLLCKIKTSPNGFKDCLTAEENPQVQQFDPCPENKVIDVLFLFTTKARKSIHTSMSPNTYANMCIAQANTTLINSGISNTKLKFNLVGTEIYTPADNYEDFQSLNKTLQPFLDDININNLRNNYKADLVVLVADQPDLSSINGATNGIGTFNPNNYKILIGVQSGLTAFVFPHEAGHQMGGIHQQCALSMTTQCDATTPLARPHGFIYTSGSTKRTMMHVNATGSSRILMYSNPNLQDSGIPTGTGTNDVAGFVSEIGGCQISDFRNSAPPLSVNIISPGCANYSSILTANAIVSNGTAPYTFQWYYLIYPNVQWIPIGTNSSVCNFPTPPNPNNGTGSKAMYIKCEITDAIIEHTSNYQIVQVPCSSGIGPMKLAKNEINLVEELSIKEEINENNNFKIFPTLAQQQLNFESKIISEKNIYIKIVDVNGKEYFSKKYQPNILIKDNINIENLENGKFYFRIISENGLETLSFIKSNH